MESDSALLNIQHNIATVTLNRPQVRNAFDDQMISILIKYLHRIQQDDNVKIVVLRGTGNDFCTGADIDWMRKTIHYSKEENYQDALALAQLMHTLYHLNKPTIALIQGHVYGGGIGLVASCDIVIGQPKMTFCFSEVKLGLIPAVISPYIIKSIGLRAAKRYILTAESFDEQRALTLGLIHEIVQTNTLEDRLKSLISSLQQNGNLAIQSAKELLLRLAEQPAPINELDYTANFIAELRTSKEGQEGLLAFLEKRKPAWQKNV